MAQFGKDELKNVCFLGIQEKRTQLGFCRGGGNKLEDGA
jgi:hypothetical protein